MCSCVFMRMWMESVCLCMCGKSVSLCMCGVCVETVCVEREKMCVYACCECVCGERGGGVGHVMLSPTRPPRHTMFTLDISRLWGACAVSCVCTWVHGGCTSTRGRAWRTRLNPTPGSLQLGFPPTGKARCEGIGGGRGREAWEWELIERNV